MRALILGGTKEARDLAEILVNREWEVTSSLAGRVTNPKLPVGDVRVGGFGGPAGLAEWIRDHDIDVVVDATHPFAEKISASAAHATHVTNRPLVALHRPAWAPQDGDQWLMVSSMTEAAQLVATRFHHIFLTIGRQQLEPFAEDSHNLYVIRCVEPPSVPLPERHRLILDRGPFTVEKEKKLFRDNQIDCVVTKNSGGAMTEAKLEAARQMGVTVVMVQRPALPDLPHMYTASNPEEAWRLLKRLA